MKVVPHSYAHESNGIGIQIVPETDIEYALLANLWRFGSMSTGHPGKGAVLPTGHGFFLTAFQSPEAKARFTNEMHDHKEADNDPR